MDQARHASDRINEAERQRAMAVQEAAYYRAKLAALEASSESDLGRLDRERLAELEQQLTTALTERALQERKVADLNDTLELKTTLLEQAETRASEAARHSDVLTDSHSRTLREHTELQERHAELEASLRDHADRLLSQASIVEQREADHHHVQSQLEEATVSRDQHARALEQTRTALQTAMARAIEVDEQNMRSRETISQLEADVAELRGELESKTAEVDNLRSRLTDTENSWAKSREEADAFRALTTGGLGELLDTQRDLKTDEDRHLRGHAEKVQVLEAEVASLRGMLKEVSQRLDDSHAELSQERRRAREGETEQMALRSQIVGLRAQLSNTLADAGRLRKDLAVREADVRQKTKEADDAGLRLGMLRNYLAENDIVLDNDGLPSESSSRLAELEGRLADFSRMQEQSRKDMENVLRQKKDAEAQMSALSTQLDRLRSTQSPSYSPATGDSFMSEARVVEAERKVEETERNFKARVQQLEDDYRLAVHCVKYVYHHHLLKCDRQCASICRLCTKSPCVR